ncbi:MAG: methyltransferase domain-containing protein [Cyanobacteria bacterium P01_F01_bin.150]
MLNTLISLENTQCPACNSSALKYNPDVSSNGVHLNAICCDCCDRSYDLIYGVPYLGTFFSDDVLGLIEISANTDSSAALLNDESPQEKLKSDRDFVFWIDLLDEYTHALNKNQVLAEKGIPSKPAWFENRYREHLLFKTVTNGISLEGKSVLDVGAGLGFDSLKFYSYGADVTCLEFSPLLCMRGKFDYPQLHWFGGSSRNLPFPDNHFDIVVATAALHHLSDIPQSLQECLRVMKPGGYLLTMSDPFRANHLSKEVEASIFNDHPDVLRGINEQVPVFSDFVQTFEEHSSKLGVRVFTNFVNEVSPHPREWSFDDALEVLSNANGDVNFQVFKREDIKIPNISLPEGDVQPGLYTKHLQNQTLGISWLVEFIPENYLNLPLLSKELPKFRLLNGWKMQKDGEKSRIAYKRARLFFRTESASSIQLQLEFLIPYVSDDDTPSISVLINSEKIFSNSFPRGVWHRCSIPLSSEHGALVECGQTFFVEIILETRHVTDDANLFRVREFTLTPDNVGAVAHDCDILLESYGIETLMKTVFKDQKSLTALVSSDLDHVLDIVGRISQFQVSLSLIVPSNQQQFYSWLPNCCILSTYSALEGTLEDVDDHLKTIQILISSDTQFNELVATKVKGGDNTLPHIVEANGFCSAMKLVAQSQANTLLQALSLENGQDSNSLNLDSGTEAKVKEDIDASPGSETADVQQEMAVLTEAQDVTEKEEQEDQYKVSHQAETVELEADLNDSKYALSAMEDHILSLKTSLNIVQKQLEQEQALTRKKMQRKRADLRRVRDKRKALARNCRNLKNSIQRLNDDNQKLRVELEAIQSSKFWKLRSLWMKIKSLVGS